MQELTREAVLAAEDMGLKRVEVPSWGGALYVRPLRLDEFETIWGMDCPVSERKLRLAFASACDAGGERLFQPEDYDAFTRRRGYALIQLITAALQVNGVIEDEGGEGKA